MLTDTEPFAVARRLASEIADDTTADQLADALPVDATVCVVGWSDLISEALLRRDDLSVLAVGSDDAVDLVTGAVLAADIVLIEALAASPSEMLATPGARAAASVAYCSEKSVWAIVGVGRRIPESGFISLVDRIANEGVADIVPLGLCTQFAPNDGGCPVALELTRI